MSMGWGVAAVPTDTIEGRKMVVMTALNTW
jgi:hypothetical protein